MNLANGGRSWRKTSKTPLILSFVSCRCAVPNCLFPIPQMFGAHVIDTCASSGYSMPVNRIAFCTLSTHGDLPFSSWEGERAATTGGTWRMSRLPIVSMMNMSSSSAGRD